MAGKPGTVLFVNAVSVKNHMDFPVFQIIRNKLVHEVQEFDTAFPQCQLALDTAGEHVQGREQLDRAMVLDLLLSPLTTLPLVVFT